MNIKFSFQKTHLFNFFRIFKSLLFLFEVCINLIEILCSVSIESYNSQKFAFEERRYYHDFNIFSFKFPKLSSSELFESHCLFELFETHFHLNYSNLNVHLNYSNLNVHLNYSKFNVHLNYPTFKFHFNFRHLDFHLNYSITAFDLMFRKSNIEYRVLKISER